MTMMDRGTEFQCRRRSMNAACLDSTSKSTTLCNTENDKKLCNTLGVRVSIGCVPRKYVRDVPVRD